MNKHLNQLALALLLSITVLALWFSMRFLLTISITTSAQWPDSPARGYDEGPQMEAKAREDCYGTFAGEDDSISTRSSLELEERDRMWEYGVLD